VCASSFHQTVETKLLRALRQHDQRRRPHRPLRTRVIRRQRVQVQGSTLHHSPHRGAPAVAVLHFWKQKTAGNCKTLFRFQLTKIPITTYVKHN